jgi:hypothetical protein
MVNHGQPWSIMVNHGQSWSKTWSKKVVKNMVKNRKRGCMLMMPNHIMPKVLNKANKPCRVKGVH